MLRSLRWRYLLKQKSVSTFQTPMRGTDTQQSSMFSYLSPERVPCLQLEKFSPIIPDLHYARALQER
jgi:hypothetical protein